MTTAAAQVVSIRDQTVVVREGREYRLLAFDLREILRALGPLLERWVWYMTDLDCTGAASSPVVLKLADPQAPGVWLSSPELVQLAAEIEQTIDGKFIAFPRGVDPRSVGAGELSLSAFPASRAEFAICAVDSTFFEVYAKEAGPLDLLRCNFKEIRSEDTARYFGGGDEPA